MEAPAIDRTRASQTLARSSNLRAPIIRRFLLNGKSAPWVFSQQVGWGVAACLPLSPPPPPFY